jgi:hypothetical protein
LLASKDIPVRAAACSILKEIGTKESLSALDEARKNGGLLVSGPAEEALKAIQGRQGQ